MPEFPESSRLDQPHKVDGTMEESKASLYELAKSRVRLLNDEEYLAWCKEFEWWGKIAKKSPAVTVVWPTSGGKVDGKMEKIITHLEIVVNKDKFQIDGEDYSDIIPFVVEHELSEAWLRAKKGLGDGSDLKKDAFEKYVAKHRLSLRREFLLAEQNGLGEKLFNFHIKVRPKEEVECRDALEKARQRLKKLKA